MTDDLTDRLRLAARPEEIASVWGLTVVRCSLLRDAADEIERLRAERDRWQDIAAGLAETSRHGGYCPSYDGFGCDAECGVGDALAAYEYYRAGGTWAG